MSQLPSELLTRLEMPSESAFAPRRPTSHLRNREALGSPRILQLLQKDLFYFILDDSNTEGLSTMSRTQLCLGIIRKLITLGTIGNSETTSLMFPFKVKKWAHRVLQSHVIASKQSGVLVQVSR